MLPLLGVYSLYWLAQPQVVLVHWNAKASTAFLPQVSELLPSVSSTSPSTLFNIQMDSISYPCTTKFLTLSDCFKITQHSEDPTHTKVAQWIWCGTRGTPTALVAMAVSVTQTHLHNQEHQVGKCTTWPIVSLTRWSEWLGYYYSAASCLSPNSLDLLRGAI